MSSRIAGGARMRGVTLIEMVTVVAIIGILAAIAIPSYNAYITRVKRTDAKRDLMSMATRLERCFTRSNDYRVKTPGGDDCVELPFTNAGGTYTISGEITASTYALTATPSFTDTKCGNLTLNQAGAQGASGSLSDQKCWQGSGG